MSAKSRPPAPPGAAAPARHAIAVERAETVEIAPAQAAVRAGARRRLGARARRHRALAVVLALYALAALVVPTLTPAPVSDDWVYARSVEILFAEGRVRILDLSVVTLIFQIAWGGLFSLVLGPTFGALRLSTVVLVFIAGIALYGLCRELGVSRQGSALGAAAYLFNPLAFVLAFSFMSDPQLTALIVISTYFYARGLRPEAPDRRAILLGSFAAGLAFLVRQQGALIPLAVVVYLVASRRLRPDRQGVVLFARVVALPALMTLAYYAWLRFVHGVPYWQTRFLRNIEDAGWSGAWSLIRLLSFIIAMYLGFFALPVAAAALTRARALARANTPSGWLLLGGWAAFLGAGVAILAGQGRRMPYVPQFFNSAGLGPEDLIGGRPLLLGPSAADWLTAICAVASLAIVLALGHTLVRRGAATVPARRPAAGLVLAVLLWQIVGTLPPSFHFRNWAGSVDRYLLPVLPLAVCLGLWALGRARPCWPAAWAVVAVLGLFAVAGTRDFLVFQGATWDLARQANALGIENIRLDAGASWDGYHLYEYSVATNSPQRTPEGRPWWVDLFAPATDSSYVIASVPLQDAAIVRWVEYSSWLHREPVYLYLLRYSDVPGPP